ncbi:hypothetical protein [Amycolatopsis sp. NPDC059657]|uniref:hypothetical protein n=1 Tax=Amycolatopsis sp. NPDC059657 TaxID=3346899 RepID=UPI00366D6CDC
MRKSLSVLSAIAAGAAMLTAAQAIAEPDAPPSDTVLLVTGDRVVIHTSPDGTEFTEVRPAVDKGIARSFVHLKLGGKSFEIPAIALPYLGNGLDMSLFDVHALAKAERDGRVPVEGRASMDADAAKAFGAALAKQYAEDKARGSFGGQGLFAAGALRLPGAAAPKVKTSSVMRTLTFAANGPDGKPANGTSVFLYNVDNGDLLDYEEEVGRLFNGKVAFSVPEGHYSALAIHYTSDAENNETGDYVVAQPEITVNKDVTVRMDASRATSKVEWVTPRPSLLSNNGFFYRRAATIGRGWSLGMDTAPGVPVWVSPSPKVKIGELQSYAQTRLVSPPGPAYEYYLMKPTHGFIPQQRYVVTDKDVTTVKASYYSDHQTVGLRLRAPTFTFQKEGGGGPTQQVVTPIRQTEYVSAAPDLRWFGFFSRYSEFDGGFLNPRDTQEEPSHYYTAGQTVTEDWNKYPLHPTGAVSLVAPDDSSVRTVPPARRAGDQLKVNLIPFGDNQPGHRGPGFSRGAQDKVAGQYTLTQNGTEIAKGDQSTSWALELDQAVDPNPSTFKLSLDASRAGPMFTLATASHTEWTWKSQHVEGATLPGAFVCQRYTQDRACAVEPLLTLGYSVGELLPAGYTYGGPQYVDLTVGHLQQAAASAITGVTTQFSLDDGATWTDAAVTGQGDGKFRAAFTASFPNFGSGYVSLRVTAQDAAGGAITETITRAFQVAR